MTLHLLPTLVTLSLVIAADEPKAERPIAGVWTVERMERAGREPPEDLLTTLRVVIWGNALVMSDGQHKETARFKLTREKKPREIDLEFKEGPNEDVERSGLGIYELDGDTLKLAWRKDGGDRPTQFKSIPGQRTSELLILKRAKGK
jgi:uncharacterized protein (TIGR03067 family)